MWLFFLFVKQKTAYEMRISDWSSDVCSSDLEKKNGREARVGSFNIAGAKAGVMDKDRIAFSYDKVGPGVFKVSPEQALAPGERSEERRVGKECVSTCRSRGETSQ